MKLLNAKTLAAVALTGVLSIGTASAMGLSNGIQPLTSITGVSSTNVKVEFDGSVATLYGFVDSNIESSLAAAHVANLDGVDRVINRIVQN
jgi:hypothetical protein